MYSGFVLLICPTWLTIITVLRAWRMQALRLDGEDEFGNALSVIRMVRVSKVAGVAAIDLGYNIVLVRLNRNSPGIGVESGESG